MEDPPSTRLIPDLPDEISDQIIARLPRKRYRSLCHVSRSWRSLLVGPDPFTLRSFLHCTEPALCLNIHTQTKQSLWMVLNRGQSHSNFLPPPPHSTLGSACATAGNFVFVLGGSLSGVPSNVVQILELGIGAKWFLGSPMSTARIFAGACFLDGHMYAIGGCLPSIEAWVESLNAFDGNAEWVPIDSPVQARHRLIHGCVVLSGRILAMAGRTAFAYDPGQNIWGPVPERLDLGWKGRAVVVNGILYSYDYMGRIVGYDAGTDRWRTVLGIDNNIPKFRYGATLANFHGILCVIWNNENKREEMMVDWVGIGVADLGSEGLHGSILWWETVALGVPCGSAIANCVVAEF